MGRAGAVRLTAELCQGQGELAEGGTGTADRERDLLAEIRTLHEERDELARRLEKLADGPGEPDQANSRPTTLMSFAETDHMAEASHAFRTPLNVMVGFADVMKQEVHGRIENPKYYEYACHIYDSGHQLLSALEDLVGAGDDEDGRRAGRPNGHGAPGEG